MNKWTGDESPQKTPAQIEREAAQHALDASLELLRKFSTEHDPSTADGHLNSKVMEERGEIVVTRLVVDGAIWSDVPVRYLNLRTFSSGDMLVYFQGPDDSGYGILTDTRLNEIPLDSLKNQAELIKQAAKLISGVRVRTGLQSIQKRTK